MKRINWNVAELENWIGTDNEPLHPRSRSSYKRAFTLFAQFTGMTAKQLINEAEAEEEGRKREKGKTRRRLLAFRQWLLTHYVSERKGDPRKGLAEKTVSTYLGGIRSFYADNNFPVRFKRSDIPTPQPETVRKMVRKEDARKLRDACTNQRDKAIIMCMFSSGMDISTLLSLNYKHVKTGYDLLEIQQHGGGHPSGRIMVTVVRPKTRWKYRTFFSKDAVVCLKNYLIERRNLRLESPLFVAQKQTSFSKRTYGESRLSKQTVIGMFRRIARKSGLLSAEERANSSINPVGSHALRASFSKIATAHGINKDIIDYFMGHKTPHSGAYTNLPDKELERIYADLEPYLQVSEIIQTQVDRLREQAKLWGIDLDAIIRKEARRLYETGAGASGGHVPSFEDPEVMASVLRDEIKRIVRGDESPRRDSEPSQKVVDEDSLEEYLANGWKFISALNNGSNRCVIERA